LSIRGPLLYPQGLSKWGWLNLSANSLRQTILGSGVA
jgi:hypothetical protein